MTFLAAAFSVALAVAIAVLFFPPWPPDGPDASPA